jgi:hypothetical protein
MQLSPSWGAANCEAIQELPSSFWNPKVHRRVHKSPPLVPILSPINPVYTTQSYLRSILILSTHLHLGLPSGLFPSGFPTNILYAFLFSPHSCYMPRPSYPPWLDHSNYRKIRLLVQCHPCPNWPPVLPLNLTYIFICLWQMPWANLLYTGLLHSMYLISCQSPLHFVVSLYFTISSVYHLVQQCAI